MIGFRKSSIVYFKCENTMHSNNTAYVLKSIILDFQTIFFAMDTNKNVLLDQISLKLGDTNKSHQVCPIEDLNMMESMHKVNLGTKNCIVVVNDDG